MTERITGTRAGCTEISDANAGMLAGFTNGACMAGIVLQQSWPWLLCDEQGIESQHCIACSRVAIPEQSSA